jgi:taurine dioxygenase
LTRLQVTQLAGAVGAEVKGIDLSADLTASDRAAITQVFADHHALFFPDQNLRPADLVRFVQGFGTPLIHPYLKGVDGHPEVHELRKTPDDTVNFGNLWHTDFTNLPLPSLANALYSITVPTHGGDTLIASTCAAFEALSDGMKRMLRGMNAVHGFTEKYKQDLKDQAARKSAVVREDENSEDYVNVAAEVVHPVVRWHEPSGREALYVNRGFTLRFEDMTEEESKPLLDFLYLHCQRPEFGMRYSWQANTLGIWDNRSTLHYASNDYPGQLRVMHRLVVLETQRPKAMPHR